MARKGYKKNPDFLAFVHTLNCRMGMQDPCDGALHAHHAGERGYGQKAPDETCIPLCHKHHHAWHGCLGVFAGWTKDERRAWSERQIAWVQGQYEMKPPVIGRRA